VAAKRTGKKPGPNTKAVMAAVTRRRQEALSLKLAGVDNVTIGYRLAADPDINSAGAQYEQGYGQDRFDIGDPPPDDLDLARLVSQDLRRSLDAYRGEAAHDADELREIEANRLDRLFVVAWRRAMAKDGDLAAIDRALRIMERRARLLGLDQPTDSGPGGDDPGSSFLSGLDYQDEDVHKMIQQLRDKAGA
jgi:hypothetical protein